MITTLQFLETYGTDKRTMADNLGKALADKLIAEDRFPVAPNGEMHVSLGFSIQTAGLLNQSSYN